ncbi:alkaline phosphatase PhoX [Engelhardtia mirabilis]|uniref:NHL repeat protein n=1 Tax=Engelhardtia mirabilis TaxID=2528011 RepID=A0A518BG14_9BACT|nr:hypothetical protein Pla133_09880 [Planctomycetes bacterium Pla133]QDV00248.1 hypothetical protein Pla86_09870 [Planctomycetes bacterium Pla86]
MMLTKLLVPLLLCAGTAAAQTYPLPATTGSTTATEGTAPFLLPAGVTQTKIADRLTLTLQGLPATFGNWDMIALDPTSRFVFVPAEVSQGSGLFRFDTQDSSFELLMVGDNSGVRESDPAQWSAATDDFGRFDPATWTPWGSVLTAEETTGGRLFEVRNPLATGGPYDVVWHSGIPALRHEGLRLDSLGNVYMVDEDNSGSIYKFAPKTPGDLSVGQSFVLRVDAYAANPLANAALDWSAPVNLSASRFGAATWVPMTDADGVALTAADPFAFVTTTGGRNAADELKGTPYGRPEDLEVSFLANGHEVLFCSLTSENRVVSIELSDPTHCTVRVFVDFDTLNLATGLDVNPLQQSPTVSPGPDTATNFDDPDNLAVDAFGDIYVVEDQNPGDVWKCVDADRDGVAEGMGIWLSLGVAGTEPTGLIADPNDPYRFWLCVMHPDSANDALWALDTRPYPGSDDDLVLRTGVNGPAVALPGEFVKAAGAGDTVALEVESPGGTHLGEPYIVFGQGALAGGLIPSPFIAGSWLNLLWPAVILDGTTNFVAPVNLPGGGSSASLVVPSGLAGFSIAIQAVTIGAGGLTLTEAHELTVVN